ncbi:MAG: 16S rRNA (guanine(527)-N(7))-methyltransferase RsmG [Planctomycetes bacterium]|nr:16S rRNA (guanine(527)-N(7))-methyltransferase RsmG [Planctomycetota bacterium]
MSGEKRPAPVPRDAIEVEDREPLAPPEWFVERAAAVGVEFEVGEVEKLGKFLAIMLGANERLNLTAITEPEEAWSKHILDSLTLVGALAELPEGARVLDVGTGAGLPGMVLAIAMPQLNFTLMDATAKKIEFLKQTARHIGVTNVEPVCGRSETMAHDRGIKSDSGAARTGGYREQFDAVVARAVGPMATIAELTVGFAKINAPTLLIKGQKADEELAEAALALQMLKVVHAGTIETPSGKIVVLEKRVATPKLYPRADGEPKRAPLGIGSGKRKRPNSDAPKGDA